MAASGAQDAGNPGEASQAMARGLVKPLNQAVISGEIPAKIISIPFKGGEAFKKDDTLIKFDCAIYRAQLASASADLDAKTRIHKNKKQLLSYNAASDIEVQLAMAEMKQASALLQAEKIRVERCVIKAPYSGRVIEVLANEHESIDAQTKLLSILNDEELEIELIVPSNWLGWLKNGDKFDFNVDETGKKYSASVSRIGAAVDPVSQTIRLTGVFDDLSKDILSGMSGTAYFRSMH
jgi:RND family efflux transporter MFP subunit